MEYDCPECNSILSFDISNIEVIILKLKCKQCGKILFLNGENTEKLESNDKKFNLDKIIHMAKMAYADGVFSPEERDLLFQKAEELNIEENVVNKIIDNIKPNKASIQISRKLVKEYDEDILKYYDEEANTYNIEEFMKKISSIDIEDPNLKKYREDLIKMCNFNHKSWIEKAQLFEAIYNQSTLETEWRQARDHMEKTLQISEHYKNLQEQIITMNKKELLNFVSVFIKKDPYGWD